MRLGLVVVAVLFLVPLWAIGELGVWSFEEPRSHLVWDEGAGTVAEEQEEAGEGPASAASRLLAGAVVGGVLAFSVGRRTAG